MSFALRRGSWMITVPLAAATVAYIACLYVPGRKAIRGASDEIATMQQFVAQTATTASALNTRKQELQETESYVAARQQRTADEKELPEVFGKIHGLMAAAGTRTTRFEPQPVVDYARFRLAPISVGCAGSFAQVHELLRRLEGMTPGVWVSSLKLDRAAENGKDVSCELMVEVFVNISGYVERSGRPI